MAAAPARNATPISTAFRRRGRRVRSRARRLAAPWNRGTCSPPAVARLPPDVAILERSAHQERRRLDGLRNGGREEEAAGVGVDDVAHVVALPGRRGPG